jgi:hypothetical protein
MLFDLEADPLEITNQYDTPEFADIQKELLAQLEQWRLPDQLPDVPLNEEAPVIDQPNVRGPGQDHRDGIGRYYREKMQVFDA